MQHGVRGAIGVVGRIVLIGPCELVLRMKRRQLQTKKGGTGEARDVWKSRSLSSRVLSFRSNAERELNTILELSFAAYLHNLIFARFFYRLLYCGSLSLQFECSSSTVLARGEAVPSLPWSYAQTPQNGAPTGSLRSCQSGEVRLLTATLARKKSVLGPHVADRSFRLGARTPLSLRKQCNHLLDIYEPEGIHPREHPQLTDGA